MKFSIKFIIFPLFVLQFHSFVVLFVSIHKFEDNNYFKNETKPLLQYISDLKSRNNIFVLIEETSNFRIQYKIEFLCKMFNFHSIIVCT